MQLGWTLHYPPGRVNYEGQEMEAAEAAIRLMSKISAEATCVDGPRLLRKPDGRTEEILHLGQYMLKRLTIPPGARTSMHFHYAKSETLYVTDGTMLVEFVNHGSVVLTAGQHYHIEAGRKNAHMMSSQDGCTYLEASTPHPDDSERVE